MLRPSATMDPLSAASADGDSVGAAANNSLGFASAGNRNFGSANRHLHDIDHYQIPEEEDKIDDEISQALALANTVLDEQRVRDEARARQGGGLGARGRGRGRGRGGMAGRPPRR